MTDELLVRAVAVVPVAVTVTLGTRVRSHRLARALVAALIVAVVLLPQETGWRTWTVIAVAAAAAALVRPARQSLRWSLVVVAAAVVAAACAVDAAVVRETVGDLLDDTRLMIVALGALACVPAGGYLIGAVLHPFAEKVGDGHETIGMEDAGRVIGWLERALLYGLVLAGAPDAAVLVIAGKSIARFPSFRSERFAEYYLIGSLLSLLVAIGTAVIVRAAIGLPALPV